MGKINMLDEELGESEYLEWLTQRDKLTRVRAERTKSRIVERELRGIKIH
jgi:hypothetical protein